MPVKYHTKKPGADKALWQYRAGKEEHELFQAALRDTGMSTAGFVREAVLRMIFQDNREVFLTEVIKIQLSLAEATEGIEKIGKFLGLEESETEGESKDD